MQYLKQQDGFIEEITQEQFEKLPASFFRAYDKKQEHGFCNCDSKNIVPYIKDILNRKHKFLEIKLLITTILFLLFIIILQFFSFWYLDNSKNFDNFNKKIDEIKTILDKKEIVTDNPYNEVTTPVRHKNIIN